MSTIAVTSTLAMVRAAEARGVCADDVLVRADVARTTLEDPDARLPAGVVMGVWNALRQQTGDPSLQLFAPAMLPWGSYRVIDYLVAASATVGEGVTRFANFFGLIAESVAVSVESHPEGHCLTIRMSDGGPVPPVYVDYVFSALITRIRLHIRPALTLLRLELRQAAPSYSAAYAEVFPAPVFFGAAGDRLWFSHEEWQTPPDNADATLAQLIEEHARILSHRNDPTDTAIRQAVESSILETLSEGATAESVARALHISVRTLQRRLEEAGTSFRDVAESVRAQLASEYLADPKVGIAEVAFLLGFSDQSSFNRAFRRWTGQTPGRWRKSAVSSRRTSMPSTGSSTRYPWMPRSP